MPFGRTTPTHRSQNARLNSAAAVQRMKEEKTQSQVEAQNRGCRYNNPATAERCSNPTVGNSAYCADHGGRPLPIT